MQYGIPEVVVTAGRIFFDGEELPWHVTKEGIRYHRGEPDDFNTLTVEFIVDDVHFTDSSLVAYDQSTEWYAIHTRVKDDWAAELAYTDYLLRSLA